jgi:prolyl oligopeptidase
MTSTTVPLAPDPSLEDPYAYLERSDDPRTVLWTAEHNARARAYLDEAPGREALVARLEALSEFGVVGVPVRCGSSLLLTARRAAEEQVSLRVRDERGERAVVDLADLDPSGLTALDWWYPSPMGTYIAYGLSRNGDEKSVLHVRRVADGLDLSEALAGTRHCSLAWFPDERGFYYTRYPDGGPYDQRVYRHVLGNAVDDDELLFGEGRPREAFFSLELNTAGTWLSLTSHEGWRRNDLYVAAVVPSGPLAFVAVAEGIDAKYEPSFDGDRLIVRTNDGAPNFRVVEIAAARPERDGWREIVPEREFALERVGVTKDALVVLFLENVRSRAYRLARKPGASTFADALPLRAIEGLGGTIAGLSCDDRSDEAFVVDADFFTPPAVRRVVLTGSVPAVERLELDVSSPRAAALVEEARYVATQEWFVSKDGTRVPMFVLARRDLARDGTAPAILYGYGGFDIVLAPTFSPNVLPWLDAGGVYAIANLRGGGEFGEAWHRDGMLERKQNVFDDFIAAAEYLGSSGIADRARIGISGGSNGGLLVAAVLVQRPELFAAVHCAVPLCDMLRYHKFLLARLWIAEYGDPDVPAEAEILRAYSPFHNVRDGVAYPPTLFVTAESDTRVDPMHARKMAARLIAASSNDAPVYCFVEPNAGHGAGKPRAKVVESVADRLVFFARVFGIALG